MHVQGICTCTHMWTHTHTQMHKVPRKSQLLWATVLISQWCHSKLICAHGKCVSCLYGNIRSIRSCDRRLATPLIVMMVS